MRPRLLLVESDPTFAQALQDDLADSFEIAATDQISTALEYLHAFRPSALVLDAALARRSGKPLLDRLWLEHPVESLALLISGEAPMDDLLPHPGMAAQRLPRHPSLAAAVIRRVVRALPPEVETRVALHSDLRRSVLVVDDDPDLRMVIVDQLVDDGFQAVGVGTPKEAIAHLQEEHYDVLLTDWILPQTSGLDLLQAARELNPRIAGILLTGYATPEFMQKAISLGAADVLVKPVSAASLPLTIQKCLQVARDRQGSSPAGRATSASPRRPLRYSLESIVGHSGAIEEARRRLALIAHLDSTALLLGETGTGKELFAQALHGLSRRAGKPFVAVNISAIPDSLIEAELFGYAPGAYTGAKREGHPGRIAQADGGTFFLDEIGDLAPSLQAKLLRVLQEGEITPVGGPPRQVDVRFVTATHRDLGHLIQQGAFRSDLFYRINVLALRLPPLRERLEDVPILVQHFLSDLCHRYGGRALPVAPEVLDRLGAYHWPGNIRELKNAVEHAYVTAGGCQIQVHHLPPTLQEPQSSSAFAQILATPATEREQLLTVLKETRGNKVKAAAKMGISRTTLYLKLKIYGLMS
ncbi:MAG: sigma 54-interacting transcriptional regulator [Bacillota bacterium]